MKKRKCPSKAGEVLRLLREVSGLTQEKLAAKMGVSRVWVYQIETHRRAGGLQFYKKAAWELGVPVAVFFARDCPAHDEETKAALEDLLNQYLR